VYLLVSVVNKSSTMHGMYNVQFTIAHPPNGYCYLLKRNTFVLHQSMYPSQSNVDNLNNVRREVSRQFKNKKKG
jgi:hypothetical protein